MILSIITINYNNVLGLKNTIESVISQSYQSFEYIVIDGDSNDGSKEVLNRFKNKITCAISEPDSGIYNAMNKGVKKASGDYCLFLNSGDTLADENVLEKLVRCSFTADIIVGDTLLSNSSKIWKSPDSVSLLTLMKGSLSHQSSLIRRTLLLEYPYDETKKIISDWKFCIETLVVHNKHYQKYNSVISLYDKTGISSTPAYFDIAYQERLMSLQELIPERILMDYDKLIIGETKFEKLMIRISRHKIFRNIIYYVLSGITTCYCFILGKKQN